MTDDNLYNLLYRANADGLDNTALLTPGRDAVSFAQLFYLSAAMATALATMGAKAGDRVLVQVDKSPDAVALYLACLRGGFVLVPLNTAYTSAELDYFLRDAEPAITVCNTDKLPDLSALISGDTQLIALTGPGSLAERAHEVAELHPVCARRANDLAAILYTSGTTGRSKGAMLSHGNLSSNALTLHRLWGFEKSDVLLHALPIFHVHGLFVALNTALLNGSKILFLDKFSTEEVLAVLPQATIMMGVPTFYTRLLGSEHFAAESCAHMRLFISGSAPLTEQTFEAFERRTGQRILERYGMSETGMITSNPLHGERVAGTVGFALPDVEVRICDSSGSPLPAGETGVIEVRGPNVFQGYWKMPGKTAEEFRDDGWFITGDLGRADCSGRVSIVGRQKDLIISGGYNVYPKEVELCLDALPGIEESAVIGVPHPDFGEAVVAVCVTPKGAPQNAGDIQDQLRQQLANFKQPKAVLFTAELPRNTMGKVQKNSLRDAYQHVFANTEESL